MSLAESERTTLTQLRERIETGEAVIGVLGLGYVGLPVACTFAEAEFEVVGLDLKPDRIELINAGRSPIEGNEPGLADLLADVVATGRLRATTDYAALRGADVVTINVETPVDADHKPRYEALRAACRALGQVLKEGALVIVESTISPGTMDRVVGPLLEEVTGRKVNEGFFLGHCPERVMPGKLLANLRNVSRVCGGSTPETAETMVALYHRIVRAELDPADCVTAELVKTAENAYRDVQIAFANEVALICEDVGADVWKVRELVNKSPGRQMHKPGAGVGGHCIPKDPWLLAAGASERTPLRIIPAARAVNDGMPLHVADLVVEALREAGREIAGARVLVLGYAYLENSDDTRNSPSEALVARLCELGAEVAIHDPFVRDHQGSALARAQKSDALVVMTAHSHYQLLTLVDLVELMRTRVLVDGRRVFELADAKSAGLVFRTVGRTKVE